MATSLALGVILEKIASKDKDFRYMATSDLLSELQKDSFKTDAESEKKICAVVLKQLEDQSGDISSLAVKSLGPLVRKASAQRVVEILEGLCEKLIGSTKEHQRDVGSLALKMVVSDVSAGPAAQTVCKSLGPALIGYLARPDCKPEVETETLEILCELVAKFGSLMAEQHEKLAASLLSQLDSNRAGLRKRAMQCLAALAPCAADGLLAETCERVLQRLSAPGLKTDEARTYVQAVGGLARAAGYRFGPHLQKAVPLLSGFCADAREGDEELHEYGLQALEACVLRCPREVAPFLDGIVALSLKSLSYDPNYACDEDEDEGEGMEEDEEDEDDDDYDDYSDDEDLSWKVRRAAAKVVSAVCCTRPELLDSMYASASPVLIKRFGEREESVKLDVMGAYVDLVRQTAKSSRDGAPQHLLAPVVPALVPALVRQLKSKSPKTKVAVFGLLKEVVSSLPSALEGHLAQVVPGIERALADRSAGSNLKIEALIFTRLAMESHPPEAFQPHLDVLAPVVFASVNDRYYKVAAEAIRVCNAMVGVMRPSADAPATTAAPYISKMYAAVTSRLTSQDQDQEVKEVVISCTGLLVAQLGDNLTSELPACLPVLLERMRNEITRLVTVKAFTAILESPISMDLSPVLEPMASELTGFLRKANRTLRQVSLQALDPLLVRQAASLAPTTIESVVTEASALISDAELQLAGLALNLCSTALTTSPSSAGVVCQRALPAALALVQSALLQGSVLLALERFFAALVSSAGARVDFDTLLNSLMTAGRDSASGAGGTTKHHVSRSVGRCVAGLCSAGDGAAERAVSTASGLVARLRDANVPDSEKVLALLCVGEIGKRRDLSGMSELLGLLMGSLDMPREEVKSAASYALGGVTMGNVDKFLPLLITAIGEQPKHQYALLGALKEAIVPPGSEEGVAGLETKASDVEKIIPTLFSHAGSEEEGVRNVVAECLGRSALVAPQLVVPKLRESCSSGSAPVRATAAAGARFAVVSRPQSVDEALAPAMEGFMALVGDEDRHTRRSAVQLLTAAAHHKPRLVAALLPKLLPSLYEQTVIRQELIHIVDLGPFKHTVDDGLDLRKAAFECLEVMLESCTDCVEPGAYLQHLKSGLGDQYDVKMTSHLILQKVAGVSHFAPALLSTLDELVTPLEKTLLAKLKSDAVKQDIDRNEDLVRSALRAIDAIDRMSESEQSSRFVAFIEKTVTAGQMGAKFAAIRAETDSSDQASASASAMEF